MRFVESWRGAALGAALGLALLTGCAPRKPELTPAPAASQAAPQASAPASEAAAASAPSKGLPPPAAVRNWDELRRQVADRLMAANADQVYHHKAPDVLLAIPVFQVELHGNGHIKRIELLRAPRQAKDTIEIARRALHKAAPFGDVHRLPKPWTFTATFLFDEDRRFKPRSLD